MDDVNLRERRIDDMLRKRYKKFRLKKERLSNDTMNERLQPNITRFGSKDADDCDATDDDIKDVGLYCPQCWEYMSNPWTLTCGHVVCQECFVRQVRILQNVTNITPVMGIGCNWKMTRSKMDWGILVKFFKVGFLSVYLSVCLSDSLGLSCSYWFKCVSEDVTT